MNTLGSLRFNRCMVDSFPGRTKSFVRERRICHFTVLDLVQSSLLRAEDCRVANDLLPASMLANMF